MLTGEHAARLVIVTANQTQRVMRYPFLLANDLLAMPGGTFPRNLDPEATARNGAQARSSRTSPRAVWLLLMHGLRGLQDCVRWNHHTHRNRSLLDDRQ